VCGGPAPGQGPDAERPTAGANPTNPEDRVTTLRDEDIQTTTNTLPGPGGDADSGDSNDTQVDPAGVDPAGTDTGGGDADAGDSDSTQVDPAGVDPAGTDSSDGSDS
jgi:hypothetical protein